jgi:hypothetical protein
VSRPANHFSKEGRPGRLRAVFTPRTTTLLALRLGPSHATISSSGRCASGQLQLTGDQCLSLSAYWCPAALKALPASAERKWTLRPSRCFLKEATRLSEYIDATGVIVKCA